MELDNVYFQDGLVIYRGSPSRIEAVGDLAERESSGDEAEEEDVVKEKSSCQERCSSGLGCVVGPGCSCLDKKLS